jgi:hypothetical protein
VGGAEDFVKWWFGLPTVAIEHADLSTLRKYSSADCGECERLAETAQITIDRGLQPRYTENPAVVVVDSSLDQGGNLVTIVSQTISPAVDFVQSDGTFVESDVAFSQLLAFDVLWNGQHWVLAQARLVVT